VKITLITNSGEPHYQLGLASGLAQQPLMLHVVGGQSLRPTLERSGPRISLQDLGGELDPKSPKWVKLARVIRYYLRLAWYAATTDSQLFHIQWPYKFVFFDRTLLNVFFKALGKRLVFTAHNVDKEVRDGNPSWKNKVSLKFMYRITDRVIVHTARMKHELIARFGVAEAKISVIPHGINVAVPESALTRAEARAALQLKDNARVLLVFGLIDRYKGLEYLVEALARLKGGPGDIQLLIAGRIKECQDYWDEIDAQVKRAGLQNDIVAHLRRIPDECVEIYFKAADALVMPYRNIFQSGVLFLAYRFGLPVLATDVGSLREDVIEGQTGFICRPQDSEALAETIAAYFVSDLYKELETRRPIIRDYALEKYSWSKIGALTYQVYQSVLPELKSLPPGKVEAVSVS
jgi:glycosyltransferase involved in cell wall biosynthesis